MPKAKLKLEKNLIKKVKVAAHYSDSVLGNAAPVGNNIVTEINFKSINAAVEFGRLLETVTGDEVLPEVTKPTEKKK